MAVLAVYRSQPSWASPPGRAHHQVGGYWAETDGPVPSLAQIEAIAVHDSSARSIELSLLQGRIETEGAWDTYVNYMFGAPARRNAFLRTIMRGLPVNPNSARASLEGAGLTADQVNRILA